MTKTSCKSDCSGAVFWSVIFLVSSQKVDSDCPPMMAPLNCSTLTSTSLPKKTGNAPGIASRSSPLLMSLACIGLFSGSILAVQTSTGIPFSVLSFSQLTSAVPYPDRSIKSPSPVMNPPVVSPCNSAVIKP